MPINPMLFRSSEGSGWNSLVKGKIREILLHQFQTSRFFFPLIFSEKFSHDNLYISEHARLFGEQTRCQKK
jgi:hypothetical protein